MAEQTEKPLYNGSCHCQAVKFTVRLDLENPAPDTGAILTKCNCTICHKIGTVNAAPQPVSSLSYSQGEDLLTDYVCGGGKVHHYFCSRCGVRLCFVGSYEFEGKKVEFNRINVLVIDGRADGKPMEDLRSIKVGYWDGKTDGWTKGMGKEPYEGGIW